MNSMPVKPNCNVGMMRDALTALSQAGVRIDHMSNGIVEQIVCSQGVKFFSHPLSTFSNYVHRLRGYPSNVWSNEFLEGFMVSNQ